MEISIKWNICRICLQEENAKGNVSNGGDEWQMRLIHNDTKLSKQIYECSGVLVDPQDSLPDKICRKCLTVLRYAVNFRNTCRNSDEYLQSVLRKAKSATSLFKLEKQREETLNLVEDVIEEIEEHDLEAFAKDELLDCSSDKRKRIQGNFSLEQSQVTKKSKVIKNLASGADARDLVDEEEKELLITKKASCFQLEASVKSILEQAEIVNISANVGLKGTKENTSHELLANAGSEIKIKDVISKQSIAEEKDGAKNSVAELKNSDTQFIMDLKIKTEISSQVESECDSTQEELGLFEESLSEEQEYREEKEAAEFIRSQDESCTTLKSVRDLGSRKDALQEESTQTIPDKESKFVSSMAGSEREFFYLLSAADTNEQIKSENILDIEDFNDTDQTEYIEMEEESKSECDNLNIEEEALGEDIEECEEANIEYLLESADESSLTALEYHVHQNENVESEKTIKRERIKRKGTGEVRVYVCDICGNHFTNRNLLNFHMKIHRNEKNFECELCYKRFNSACNLSAHMRIHTGEKPYECQYCARRFTDRSTHIKHERIHTNEKPYTCGTCGKSFSLSTSLRAHEKIHTGEKPYRCEPCSKSFKLPHQLKAHLNTHLHKLLSVEQ